jgi:hypothetical protein
MLREKCKWEDPMSMRVPMRGTGAEQPVTVMKVPKGAGAKGLHCPALQKEQPIKGEDSFE